MIHKIDLAECSFGYTYKDIKKILQIFDAADKKIKNFSETDTLELDFSKLQTKKVKKVKDISLIIAWRMAQRYSSLKFKKIMTNSEITKDVLEKRRFFDRFFGKHDDGIFPTPINLESFALIDVPTEKKVTEVVDSAMSKVVKGNYPIRDEVAIHLYEMINNAFDHSRSTQEAACIMNGPEKESDNILLDCCIVDMGEGFKESYLKNPAMAKSFVDKSDAEVIKESTGLGITCNPKSNPKPGYKNSNAGLGLHFLNEFIMSHKDSLLVIVSRKGYYYADSTKKIIYRDLGYDFPGTVIYFRTDVLQDKNPDYFNQMKATLEQTTGIELE